MLICLHLTIDKHSYYFVLVYWGALLSFLLFVNEFCYSFISHEMLDEETNQFCLIEQHLHKTDET